MEQPWERLMSGVDAELLSHLKLEQVLARSGAKEVQVQFTSDILIEDRPFRSIVNALQRNFPQTRVSVIVRSPELAGDFLQNPQKYYAFIEKCLKRKYPGYVPFFQQAVIECKGNVLSILTRTEIAPRYMQAMEVDRYLEKLIDNVFGAKVHVIIQASKVRQEQMDEILRRRREADELEIFRKIQEQNAKAAQEEEKKKHAIHGRPVTQPPVPIREIVEETGRIVIEGKIIRVEDNKDVKGGEMRMISFLLTDFTSTMRCKMFLRYKKWRGRRDEQKEEDETITPEEREAVERVAREIRENRRVAVRGKVSVPRFGEGLEMIVDDVDERPSVERMDTCEEKRIELHMHTSMSEMDAITSVEKLIDRVASWGHRAVAVTDHGVVQAFPAAFGQAKKRGIKLLPGMEGYLTDTTDVVVNPVDRETNRDIVVVDFETTGLNCRRNRIIEIGAVRIRNGQVVQEYSRFVHPGEPIPPEVTRLTGITDGMVADARPAAEEIPPLLEFIGDAVFAGHNAQFDYGFLREECRRLGIELQLPVLDTLEMSRRLYPELKSHRLGAVCKQLGVSLKNAHRAVHDARATAEVLNIMLAEASKKGIRNIRDINDGIAAGAIGEASHVVLIACSQDGMTNLNRIVSEGHLNYFSKRPHVPRFILQRYREGLIVGSACASGELYKAILARKSDKELRRIARFYDYLEIQPDGNNAFLVREGTVEGVEELHEINRKIIALGEELGIPVCATGDVHFMDPEDAVFRSVIQHMKGFKDADEQPPLYLKTTQEMLDEFSYLGEEKCREVVITNPGKVADRIGEVGLYPKHPEGKETFQPYWPDAADNIRNLCDDKVRELYGDNPPEIVVARKEKELKSILGYGYGTLYNIAEKLVKKSNADGYLVGSRGSVGSSYVAHLVGISEVNALPPHYRCPVCRTADFNVDRSKYKVGPDLPVKMCEVCGSELVREGFDIPFEVFLGFKGDKVPDIDLNFSGEYQAKAHAYIEELFGKPYCYRAGTIGKLAEKTAFGYVKHYCEEKGITLPRPEMDRLAAGCEGVKRTTGQHPAGMVVLPKEYEIYQFVAIQHPANDMTSPTITTHYDFKSMHDVLVKLDVLGHDDPTMIRMLEDLTGIKATTLPLTDPGVIALFSGTESLGVTPEQIGANTGTYGVPEFGTAFVRQMLEETRPHTMEELIRISGLSHGTDVWLGNAQDIIRSGTAPLADCICCRDDIMNALIDYQLEPKMSFDIMERVRKGKGITDEMEQAMIAHKVPDWFIGSCKKIKYMFPKGHAVAYVTMALRVAWYKVHRPAAYYCAYYTVRADAFDCDKLGGSLQSVREQYQQLKNMEQKPTGKEEELMVIMELVIEMNCRGIHLLPIDLEKSDAVRFQLVSDTEIRMPFNALPGLGSAAAESIVEARNQSPFLSVQDLMKRAKISQTVCDQLREMGALNRLQETDQISFF